MKLNLLEWPARLLVDVLMLAITFYFLDRADAPGWVGPIAILIVVRGSALHLDMALRLVKPAPRIMNLEIDGLDFESAENEVERERLAQLLRSALQRVEGKR